MSQIHPRRRPRTFTRSARLHAPASLARLLLGGVSVMFAACVIPPSLSVDDQDAGVNSPPAITSIVADEQVLPDSGTVNFTRGVIGAQMIIGLLDTDVNDTLYVGAYIDYSIQDPEPMRSQCPNVTPTGSAARTCTMDISGLCPSVGTFQMTVQVFDRDLDVAGVPLYKKMVDAAGLSTNRSYELICGGS